MQRQSSPTSGRVVHSPHFIRCHVSGGLLAFLLKKRLVNQLEDGDAAIAVASITALAVDGAMVVDTTRYLVVVGRENIGTGTGRPLVLTTNHTILI